MLRSKLSFVTRLPGYGPILGGKGVGDRHFLSGVAKRAEALEMGGVQTSQIGRRVGGLFLLGAMGLVGYSVVDDMLIYNQCSSKAMERASQDPRLKQILGDEIERGPWHWYEASLSVGHEGHSASCSFPVSGTEGSGNLHLRAVRLNGKDDQLLRHVLDRGQWQVLMLEALVPSSGEQGSTPKFHRINLMQASDDLKTGDGLTGEAGLCISSSLREV